MMYRVLASMLVAAACLGKVDGAVPTIDRIDAPQNIKQDSGLQFLQLTGLSSGDRNEGLRKVDASSDNESVLKVNIAYAPGASTATLSLDPQRGMSGRATVSVLLIDDMFEATTKSFVINVQPSATDCVYSQWSSWSACSKVCGGGVETRTRTILVEGANGGRRCESTQLIDELPGCNPVACRPPTLDAISTKFVVQDTPGYLEVYLSGITDGNNEGQNLIVSASTRDSSKIFDLSVDYNFPDTSAGLRYQLVPGVTGDAMVTVTVVDSEEQFVSRTFQITILPEMRPQDCQWEWQEWSSCSSTCGTGRQVRQSTIVRSPRNNGQRCPTPMPTEERACNSNPCPQNCVMGWDNWSQCSKTCGGGVMTRTEIVKVPAAHGGQSCPQPYTEEAPCATAQCPRDCISEWSEWSTCSQTCGGGVRSRNRLILQQASRGGAACLGDAVEYEECGTRSCPQDCEYTWGAWGACSAECDGGIRRKSKEIMKLAANGGVPCLPEWERPFDEEVCNTQACAVTGNPASCDGHCNNIAPSGCGCDSTCSQYNDCCEDYVETCVMGPSAGSCLGRCEEETPDPNAFCWCDDFCKRHGDCCEDYERACVQKEVFSPESMKTCKNRCFLNDRDVILLSTSDAKGDAEADEVEDKRDTSTGGSALKDIMMYQMLTGNGGSNMDPMMLAMMGGGSSASALMMANMMSQSNQQARDPYAMSNNNAGKMNPLMMYAMVGDSDVNPMMFALMAKEFQPKPNNVNVGPNLQYGPTNINMQQNQFNQQRQQQQQRNNVPMASLMMMSALKGDSMNQLTAAGMMGPEALQAVVMSNAMSGQEMESNELMKAMMLSETMSGSVTRATNDGMFRAGELVEDESSGDSADAEEEFELLPPVRFMGTDDRFKGAADKKPKAKAAGAKKQQAASGIPEGFAAAESEVDLRVTVVDDYDYPGYPEAFAAMGADEWTPPNNWEYTVITEEVPATNPTSQMPATYLNQNANSNSDPYANSNLPTGRFTQNAFAPSNVYPDPYSTTTVATYPVVGLGSRAPLLQSVQQRQQQQQQQQQTNSLMELLVYSKLFGKSSSNAAVRADTPEDKALPDGVCFCDANCAKTGDCCADFDTLCTASEEAEAEARAGSRGGSGLGLLGMNALMGNPLGMDAVDPMTGLALGMDPVTIMLMQQQKEQEQQQQAARLVPAGSCQLRCGQPAVTFMPPNVGIGMPLNAGGSVMYRTGETNAVQTEFTNDANLPVDFVPAELEEAKEDAAEAEAGVEDRAFMFVNGATNQRPVPVCGCDAQCSVLRTCCRDYRLQCQRVV